MRHFDEPHAKPHVGKSDQPARHDSLPVRFEALELPGLQGLVDVLNDAHSAFL